MSGVNKVILVGRLGADPEVKNLTGGTVTARLSVATSETWTDKSNEKQERTEWHRVVAFGKLAELAGKYLKKGRQVYLEGKVQTRSWEDPQGVKKYTTEIIMSNIQFLGDKSSSDGQQQQSSDSGFADNSYGTSSDDDIPF